MYEVLETGGHERLAKEIFQKIKDEVPTELITNAQIYSLEEKQVGVWIDGRPLYQKTFERNVTLAGGSWASTGDSILNGKAIDAEVTAIGQGSDTVPVWCEIGADGHIELLNIRNSGSVTITHYTIRYYKTTDSAGSGGYQAYGFSPIIYSEEEREVGVWVNNKPLYQKTYELQSEITVTNNWDWTSLGISAGDIEIYVSAVAQNNSGTCWAVNCSTINGNIAMSTGRNQDTIGVKRFTIQYTKTTDTAGSGSYNTLGVPTVH